MPQNGIDSIQQLDISPSSTVALSYPAAAVFLWLGDLGIFHYRISYERAWPNHGHGRFYGPVHRRI